MRKCLIGVVFLIVGLYGCTKALPQRMNKEELEYANKVELEETAKACENIVRKYQKMEEFPYLAQAKEYSEAKRDWEQSDRELRAHLRSIANRVRSARVPETMAEIHARMYRLLEVHDHSEEGDEEMVKAAEEFLLEIQKFRKARE